MVDSLKRLITRSKALLSVLLLVVGALFGTWKPAMAFSGGTGTPSDPYRIETCSEFTDIANDLSASYELVSWIDCTSISLAPIGDSINPFTGTINGNGNTITNATINSVSGNAGLFGYTDGATIENIRLVDSSITGNSAVGAFVGYAGGTDLSRLSAYNTTVSAPSGTIGGLVGTLGGSTMSESFAEDITVSSGGATVGGLVGWLVGPSSLSNSYVMGVVDGPTDVGGVVGLLGVGPSIVSTTYADVTFIDAGSDVVGDIQMGGMTSANFMASAPYLSNNLQSPLDSWDFDTIWYVRTANYPGIRPTDLSMLCNAPSSTDTSITGSCTSLPDDLQTPLTWEIQYKPDVKSDWIVRPGQTADIFSDTVNGLVPGTDYILKFRHTSVLGVSPWGTMTITTTGPSDSDGDGVINIDEAYSPNNGDANNDATSDYLQANVTSIYNSTTLQYATVHTSCNDNFNVQIGMESSGSQADSMFDYPNGLVSFVGRGCGTGATVNVVVYFYGINADTLVLRKHSTNGYIAVPATLSDVTIGGQSAVKAMYNVVDGGNLDDDGIADGNIVDPVGLAQAIVGAPNTGLRPVFIK